MRVVSLEVVGFKSFAGRVLLPLSDGMTAVIGPNGTGKSNLTDAVRWVLGEQRPRPLRVDRMEDLLHAGEGRRRAAGVADCALTLDNADGRLPVATTEVELRRRLYRDGTSEYLVNRRPVRLKDLERIVAAAGLTPDGAFFVAQGRVDEVLRARPIERRRMVEEAAGIAPLEEERQRTLSVLEDRDGVLGQLAKQRAEGAEELSRWAQAAARLREEMRLRTEVRTLGLALGRRELARDQANEERLSAEVGQTAKARVEAGLAVERLTALTQDAQHTASRVAAAEASSRTALTSARRRAEEARREAERLAQEQRSLVEKERTAAERVAELDRAVGELAMIVEHDVATVRTVRETWISAERHREQVMELSKAHLAFDQKTKAAFARAQAREERSRWHRRLDEAKRTLSSATDAFLKAQEQKAQAKRAWGVALAGLKTAQSARDAAVRGEETARAKAHTLVRLLAEGEGHVRGTRLVLEAFRLGRLSGILGAVSDLLKVPEPYQIAIETALGGAASDVVVDHEADARAAIAYLRREGGRATFLPLDLLKPRPRPTLPVSVRSDVTWAADLVQSDERLSAVREHLLGRTLVAANLEVAVTVGRALDLRIRVVTLEGDLLAPGGAITGGQRRGGSGRWALSREAAAASVSLTQATALREAADAETAGLESAWRHAEQEIAEAERVKAEWEGRVSACRREIGELEKNAPAPAGDEEGAALIPPQGEMPSPEVMSLAAAEADRLAREVAAHEARLDMRRAELDKRSRDLEREEARRQEVRARMVVDQDRPRQPDWDDAQAAWEKLVESRIRLSSILGRLVAPMRERLGEERGELRALDQRLLDRQAQAQAAARRTAQRVERLRETYGEEALSGPVPAVPPGAEVRLRQAETALSALGGVDPRAEEAYREALRQAERLETEARDLEAGRQALADLARQTGQRLEQAYAQALETVRREFAHGCEALLQGEGEVIEAGDGLELRVKLPGKRRLGLSSLSGGERSLAALAFLLALLRASGGGFYVLDEVEAALDGPNAGRFARYLRSQVAAQFLAITHQRATMEAASAIVGVTAEEPGVSQLVAVRLADESERSFA